jgi:hypothetical protein
MSGTETQGADRTLPVKAYNNHQFLFSPSARSIRMQCELAEPAQRFREMGVRNTIVFFGSARISPPKEAVTRLREVERETATGPDAERDLEERRERARRDVKSSRYYQDASDLARHLSAWSQKIEEPRDRFVICSGGGPGIMEAANRGASESGAPSIGLGISLPFEQGLNPYVDTRLGSQPSHRKC